ncbi:MAG: hypothetical protein HVN35_11045 [Methanobacteriaceae archaeon]|nr:hypothetical protein [Methanobacteriaceae archaeon]
MSGCIELIGTADPMEKTSTGGNFENEWVKFQYPPEMVVLDNSNSTECKLEIYNSSNTSIENLAGEIFYYKSNRTVISSTFYKGKKVTIADKTGLKIEDGLQVCCYVFLTAGDIDVPTMILTFDAQRYRDAYQKIADSMVIKKISS